MKDLDSVSTHGEMKTQRFDTSGSTAVTDVFLTCCMMNFFEEKNIKKIVLKQSLFLS